ncbi:hypothetical protein [Hyalangium rubrum]|uniref:Uncharacterized protein n=1 Tax=Hyalangium rubrum TaxID=3103134 RepID=A0ABU5GZX8_9BACT|nr:hypothetical protein [Hyalangium sp. s54d21]MDY7226591.1 hypothetical protein [Hyalangium sp. s54d21]
MSWFQAFWAILVDERRDYQTLGALAAAHLLGLDLGEVPHEVTHAVPGQARQPSRAPAEGFALETLPGLGHDAAQEEANNERLEHRAFDNGLLFVRYRVLSRGNGQPPAT